MVWGREQGPVWGLWGAGVRAASDWPSSPAGDPVQCGAWAGQCALYIVIMVFEKSVVFIVLLILQWKKVCLSSPLQ